MPVVVKEKKRYQGVSEAPGLNVDQVIVEIPGEIDDYIVEGYIDLRNMGDVDSLVICEDIAVDGKVYSAFLCASFSGKQENPVIRFHTKTLLSAMKYRVRYYHVAGYVFPIYFGFIEEVMGKV